MRSRALGAVGAASPAPRRGGPREGCGVQPRGAGRASAPGRWCGTAPGPRACRRGPGEKRVCAEAGGAGQPCRERGQRELIAEQSLSLARLGNGDLLCKWHRAVGSLGGGGSSSVPKVGPKLSAGSRDLCLCHRQSWHVKPLWVYAVSWYSCIKPRKVAEIWVLIHPKQMPIGNE